MNPIIHNLIGCLALAPLGLWMWRQEQGYAEQVSLEQWDDQGDELEQPLPWEADEKTIIIESTTSEVADASDEALPA
jgi:hypothetical protein